MNTKTDRTFDQLRCDMMAARTPKEKKIFLRDLTSAEQKLLGLTPTLWTQTEFQEIVPPHHYMLVAQAMESPPVLTDPTSRARYHIPLLTWMETDEDRKAYWETLTSDDQQAVSEYLQPFFDRLVTWWEGVKDAYARTDPEGPEDTD